MIRRRVLVRMVAGAVGAASLSMASPGTAEAYGRLSDRHSWSRSRVIISLPGSAIRLRCGDGGYYYSRGRYYRRHDRRGYVAVPAPAGARISRLPAGNRTVVIDGVTYHEYDGVYYKGGPAGYTVVRVYDGDAAAASEQTLIVNIPNKNGSYMPVKLQLASNGTYIGPQGEVYPTTPTTEQLQAMYGK